MDPEDWPKFYHDFSYKHKIHGRGPDKYLILKYSEGAVFLYVVCSPVPMRLLLQWERFVFYYPNTPSQHFIYKLLESQSLQEMKAKGDIDKFSSVFLISFGKSAIFSSLFLQ